MIRPYINVTVGHILPINGLQIGKCKFVQVATLPVLSGILRKHDLLP